MLEHHLGLPPEAALIVLTSVLGASANWLVLRWAYALLRRQGHGGADEGGVAVVLVSFMRDASFWKDGASKLVGCMSVDELQHQAPPAGWLAGRALANPSSPPGP